MKNEKIVFEKPLIDKSSAKIAFYSSDISHTVTSIAAQINNYFCGDDLLVLCVMKGGMVFFGHLITQITIDIEIDYLHATRYMKSTKGAALQWLHKPEETLLGRKVLIVDDICDEGVTIAEVKEYCVSCGASAVYSAVLVDRNCLQKRAISPDFYGFKLNEKGYIFGYGIDYKGWYRNLPDIHYLSESNL